MGRIRLTAFLALPIAVSIMLGAIARDAQADICKKKRLGSACVNSKDVQDKSLGAVKRGKSADVKDEAGMDSASDNGFNPVRVILKPPRKGWAVATASVEVARGVAAGPGIVRCDLTATGGVGGVIAKHAFTESVNSAKGVGFTSLASTFGFPVKKAKKGKTSTVVTMSCAQLSGNVIVRESRLIVQYFPTQY